MLWHPLFESIKVVDGKLVNLEWHQQRVDDTRKSIFGNVHRLILEAALEIPEEHDLGMVKCRVSYGEDLGQGVFSEYNKRKIKTLQQVECEPFDYNFKYEDRTRLDQLYEQRGSCDEVLITHDGFIKDTSYSNVVLYDGTQWYTPEKPLLGGTQRAKLLASGLIKPSNLHISDLPGFKKLVLINAMLEFPFKDSISINKIKLWGQPRITF